MNTQTGQIIESHGEKVVVSLRRHATCEHCGKCKGMDFGIGKSDETTIEVENTIQAQVGDMVEIEVDEMAVVEAAVITYILPILALIAGYFATVSFLPGILGLPSSEGMGILGGGTFFALAVFVIRKLNPWFERRNQSRLRIRRL